MINRPHRIEITTLAKEKQIFVQKIQKVLFSKDQIQIAYLYGSFISEDWRSSSDIDIGIYLNPQGLQDKWFDITLANEIATELGGNIVVDVRVLNHRSPKFVYEAIFNTPRLLVRDENEQIEFETKIILEWYDMRPTWEQFYTWQKEVI